MVLALLATACGSRSTGGDAGSTSVPASAAPVATVAPTLPPPITFAPADDLPPDCETSGLVGSTVSTVGFGAVSFGMSVRTAEGASDTCLAADREVNGDCYYVLPAGGPEGVALLVTARTIERVDIFSGTTTTRSGAGIGTTELELQDLFPDQIEIRDHPTDPNGHELWFVPRDEGDAKFRVVFETDGTRVTRFRSGRIPQVNDPVTCPLAG